MRQRYARAVQMTAPKVAAQTPGVSVDGYWLDERRFYFLAERFEPTLGYVVAIPTVADRETRSAEEVIDLAELARLLSGHAGSPVSRAALASAGFDMPDGDTLAVSVDRQHYRVDLREKQVTEGRPSIGVPALYSPDGRFACFVRGHDLWLKELETGAERALTTGGNANNCYGQKSESCLSAVSYRRRPNPMGLWSADSEWFLTHRVDERSVPELPLVQHVPPDGGRPVLHVFKYPMPGDPLPVATYVAVHVPTGRVVTFDEHPALATTPWSRRIEAWFGARQTAWFVRLDRYRQQAELVRLDLADGTSRIVLRETVDDGYLELHHLVVSPTPNVRTMDGSGEVIWFSERDGWGHLYLFDIATGALKNRITAGDWMVRDIVHVDEERRRVLFTACGVDPEVDPARRSLCAANLDGSGFEVICAHDGDIVVAKTEPVGLVQDRPFSRPYAQPGISPECGFAAVSFASVDRGNHTRIVDLRTREGFVIASASPAPGTMRPLQFTALAADGKTTLHGVLYLPSDFDERRRYPLIDHIYPGPQCTHKPQSMGSSGAFAQALAELGFVTTMFDTRGMAFRSRALHQIGYGRFLEPQLADHAAVVRQLCERYDFLDRDRVGMFGYSGGGHATARALFDYGDTFKVGVAVCGNDDNTFYHASWSDKYRGPRDLAGWAGQANNAAAHKLEGKLLLISGDMDENVHVSHTLSMVDALVRANRDFDLLIVPNEGHHTVLNTNGYVHRRVWDYFVRHLLGEMPPRDFEVKFDPHEIARMESRYARGVWE